MTDTVLYLIYAGIFVGVLFAVEGLFFFIRSMSDGHERNVNRRMRMLSKSGDGRMTLQKLRREEQGDFSKKLASIIPSLENLIASSGVMITTTRLFVMMGVSACAVFAALRLFVIMPTVTSIFISIVAGFALPYLYLAYRRDQRMKKFVTQLPDAMELMVRSLSAGHPVPVAMEMVAKEMPDPIGTEFGMAIDEMTYGLEFEAALQNMLTRIPNLDLRMLVIAINIQRATGGNLSEILQNLSNVIRSRFNMVAKVKAASAEGRMSGIFVGSLPAILGVFVHTLNPDYFGAVWDDPWFLPMMGLMVVLLITGAVTIWRMVNFKV